MQETQARSLMKSITWRMTGTLDTFVISFLITGHVAYAASISFVEVITKLFLYYVHERSWTFFSTKESHLRSLTKGITWRITGTLDTFLISLLITGELTYAASISMVEVATKIILYYFHERIWTAIPWGKTWQVATSKTASRPLSKQTV